DAGLEKQYGLQTSSKREWLRAGHSGRTAGRVGRRCTGRCRRKIARWRRELQERRNQGTAANSRHDRQPAIYAGYWRCHSQPDEIGTHLHGWIDRKPGGFGRLCRRQRHVGRREPTRRVVRREKEEAVTRIHLESVKSWDRLQCLSHFFYADALDLGTSSH